ncbi:glycosyltransferase family 4 protein [Luteibacter anthropi]|uniref:glycosyltransferase family 4 protein n=1 Tax=Luteibacter anthropi TaxID=564369 RepID=UPI00203314BD|nr:glycosyltransferase family 1 protein [Luteibacter anthropi]URX63026.1 glycosyltransferase family 4 protein [Luteibacter anthropi]
MKIVLDMQGMQTDSCHRGIGRYTRAASLELVKQAAGSSDYEVQLFFNAALDGIDEAVADFAAEGSDPHRRTYGPVRGTSFDNPSNDARRHAAERMLSHALDASGADVVWLTSVIEGLADDAVAPATISGPFTVATLYDLIPLHDPEYLGKSRARDWYMHRLEALRKCDLLLAISAWVRDDAVQRLGIDPARIAVIGAGVSPSFRPERATASGNDTLAGLGIQRPFVLYNGGMEKRKNVAALFPAFAALPPNLRDRYQLVVVGRIDETTRNRFNKAINAAGLGDDHVVFTGYVCDDDLILLYQSCELFVFPSEREGFGLPPLEAMACGAPVIANNATSVPEVVGNPEALFDGADTASITSAMRRVLEDTAWAAELRETGLRQAAHFSWGKVVSRALDAIRQAMSPHGITRRRDIVSWADVSQPSDVQALTAGQMPIYRMNEANVSRMLHCLRDWPGLVEWSGPLPSAHEPGPLARYRARGWDAVATPTLAGWSQVLQAEAIAWRQASDEPSRIQWAGTHDCHPVVRQRNAEDDIGRTVAAHLATEDLAHIADGLERATPATDHRWLVDVTHIALKDLGTGIQRVVRSILSRWLRMPPAGVRIEPIMFRDGRYHHAHAYAARLLDLPLPEGLNESVVQVKGDETFVGLDWALESLPSSAALLRTWRRAGVRIHIVVNDLLPVTLPAAFHPHTCEAFTRWLALVAELADAAHCISRSTADDLEHWLQETGTRHRPKLRVFPLGVERVVDTSPGQLDTSLSEALEARPSFLMVGTLEPRKGHRQALDAFELLWETHSDMNLVIVGKRGWLVTELIQKLEHHPELGKRLFWLEHCKDKELHALYAASTALLAPSLGEGFGLPVIEAAQRGKPVIARALKVFREVAGDYPSYFEGTSAESLATHLARWTADRAGTSPNTEWPTWDDAASTLAAQIAEIRLD